MGKHLQLHGLTLQLHQRPVQSSQCKVTENWYRHKNHLVVYWIYHFAVAQRYLKRQEEIMMRKNSTFVPLGVLNIDPESPVPIYRQLYTGLRNAILNGQLASGTQLPSTRALASELGFARGTILNAYEQLLAEGYLEGEMGGGTYVARELPDELLQAQSVETVFP